MHGRRFGVAPRQFTRISAGERSPKYRGSGFWMQPGIGGPNRNPFIFAFSVPQRLRGAKVLPLAAQPLSGTFTSTGRPLPPAPEYARSERRTRGGHAEV